MSWYKIKDAAKYARVSPHTLRNWIKQGLRHSRPTANSEELIGPPTKRAPIGSFFTILA
jgi:hypothetical protein